MDRFVFHHPIHQRTRRSKPGSGFFAGVDRFCQQPQCLSIAFETAERAHQVVQRAFAGVPERGVAEIVCQAGGLDEIRIDMKIRRQVFIPLKQIAADRPANLGDFDGMRQAGPIEVILPDRKDLGLRLQAPESGRVDDAVAVLLERAAIVRIAPTMNFCVKVVIEGVGHGRQFLRFSLRRLIHWLGGWQKKNGGKSDHPEWNLGFPTLDSRTRNL